MAERLKWCLDYRNQEWKYVIFSDETSVVLGGVRGRRRVWRLKEETYHEHVITRRWKGKSEFMWWSCFSYYEKGPYHIWATETAADKKAMHADLAARNEAKFEGDLLAWIGTDSAHRLHATRAQPGKHANFKHTKHNGKLVVDEGKGGINWYRYQEKVLKPLLLPFAKKLLKRFKKIKVQEDNAPAHLNRYSLDVFREWQIDRMLWRGNSPDLNAIEPTWFWMKRETTKREAITSEKELKKAWIKCWEDMPQELIQAWIEWIPNHIEEIIACDGNNLYKEGRKKGQEKKRIH